jgi:hypothetical protein
MTIEAMVQQVTAESISSSNSMVLDLNLTISPKDFDSFQSEMELTMIRDARVNALVGWFDVEMTPGVWLSTSPF